MTNIDDINKKRNIPDNTSNIKAENNFAISNLLPDSIIIQDKPVDEPVPATNSATTVPIKANPIDVFMPVKI